MLWVGVFAAGYPTGVNNVDSSIGGQLMGMATFLPLGFLSGWGASWILKKLNILRVPVEVELEGLDMAEYETDFYPEHARAPRDAARARRHPGAVGRADPRPEFAIGGHQRRDGQPLASAADASRVG